ncbi:replicative helicase loader/inhibitor [Lacrimispora sp.]|uniref:replicative helicase loader/inhibitor n=1 Tax=Lacrimispora sp. TaxID=2719234 RepID=UPI0034611BC9
MTKQEFAVFMATINTAYPRCELYIPDQTTLWYEMLGHIPFDVAKIALKKYILSNKFPPMISDISLLAADLMEERIPDSDEAWGEINKAIRRYGYMREAEALESLSEPVRKAVERIGFQNICQSPYEQQNTLRAQFRGAYEAEYRRSMEIHKMPAQMRIEQAAMQQAALPMKEVADGRRESP